MILCKCGCGTELIQKYRRYIPSYAIGHGRRGSTNTESHKKAISEANMGRHFKRGPVPESVRKRISKTLTGIKHSPARRENISKALLEYRKTHKVKNQDTIPELLVKARMDAEGLRYLHPHLILGSIVDFFIPDLNLIVEVDGCLYHACSECFPDPDGWICKTQEDQTRIRTRDSEKDRRWKSEGYEVLRVPEHLISQDRRRQ